MSTYRYQPGDRPLDGYTVRAPAGRGGFGEVYFAESDAGREVALKALYVNQGYDEIELRGIRHCMNLKSPHLVSIFDVKTAEDATPFVVMEYVAGPSLRDLLNDSPEGLGPDKAAFFLREVAKGLTHLHGYGVVHRDLKPANIFYEDGYVKIGDYGLSKLMSADPVASQTVTVGTVHYMAPEIGAGKYDKSIDLYALGCLLYEMLTGRVPYAGDSPSEVLMKHLQAEPELDDVPEAFARVIRKALQKDPADRYASATEMVEDLFGTEHVRNSVSQLNADELSVIAKRVGRKVADGEDSAAVPGSRVLGSPAAPVATVIPSPSASPARSRKWPEKPWSWTAALAAVLGLLISVLSGAALNDGLGLVWTYVVAMGLVSTWVATHGLRLVKENAIISTTAAHKILIAIVVLAASGICAGMFIGLGGRGFTELIFVAGGLWILMMLFVDWERFTSPQRAAPFSLSMWLTLVAVGAVLGMVFLSPLTFALAGIAVITAVGAQLTSPQASVSSMAPPRTTPPVTPIASSSRPPTADAAPVGESLPRKAPSPSPTSRHSRLAAVLLCAVWIIMPLGGLHRFYVGKWFTGLLWLFTFGLFGIGQLIDGILILCGAFNDRHGKPLVNWSLAAPPPAPQDANDSSAERELQRTWTPRIAGRVSPLAVLLHLLGILLLLVGLALMVPVWLSVPELINELPVFAEFRDDVSDVLEYDAWPLLAGRAVFGTALVVLLVGTLCVAVARRGSTPHLARAAFGGGAMLCGGAMLVAHNPKLRAVRSWEVASALEKQPLDAQLNPLFNLDVILGHALGGPFFMGLVWLGVALAVLMIPAQRHPSTLTHQAPEVTS